MVKRLIGLFISVIFLSSCNSENNCDYFLIDQELKIDESYNRELLFCVAYRDFLTDGEPQDIFVIKIKNKFFGDYIKDNALYKQYSNKNTDEVLSPFSLIERLNNEVGSSKKKEEYRDIIDKINPENSYYYFNEKENYYVESLIDENGYIVLFVGR
ncbi:MAG: hypothetical protein ABJN95_05625 [Maribacter sp.]|uniref:hypothetical protein n=1 Tax=Maribacter sp. TaxID=1897614 RepID=UPI0032986F54